MDESNDSQIIKITARNQTNVTCEPAYQRRRQETSYLAQCRWCSTGGLAVHGVFERFTRFELRRSQSSDLDGCAGLRIATGTGGAFRNAEAAEAGDLHLTPLPKCFANHVAESGKGFPGIGPTQTGFGRRLTAMQSLVSEGRLKPDHPVACLVHDGDPQEVSLAENVVRLSMHALD